ncbi:hypothetical protein [Microscilla marina]|uniref:Uncharacterized protein n=1 Tax=Microscilla marina ATCC 23134 TaxID=313606 RepID=A1ZMG1_MICM2|nr:hypothetical protein [Microscilla marina]EAY28341.1 hypothetical protein M23134_03893 [Microscilla marina ATCC 23134]
MKKVFKVPGTTDIENLIFYVDDQKSEEETKSLIADLMYHHLIHNLLILINDYSGENKAYKVDYFSHLEEHLSYLSSNAIAFVKIKYPALDDLIQNLNNLHQQVKQIFTLEWDTKIKTNHLDWRELQENVKLILNKLGVEISTDVDEYEENLDYDFLFD